MQKITVNDHSRDSVGLKYVYPAISRRSGGLSIGINFNCNNACNWRCLYCQVPNLIRGTAPAMDFALLEQELRSFLIEVLHGDFCERFAIPLQQRIIKDIAISGNGEPTSLPEFSQAISLIGDIATELGVFPQANFVLITNGSLIHQEKVQQGLIQLQRYGGQIWFKLDSATEIGRKLLNNAEQSPEKAFANLCTAASLCWTKIQTCVLHYPAFDILSTEKNAYFYFLKRLQQQTNLNEVLLYTIARPSFQPEAKELMKFEAELLEQRAEEIRALGYQVSLSY